MTRLERFRTKYEVMPSGCWEWRAACFVSRGQKQYGAFWWKEANQNIHASRAAWLLMCSPIPSGLMVLHHCDNPPCVNPDHLYLGTNLDNKRDMVQRDRASCGEQRHNAKLTAQNVRTIRELYRSGAATQVFLAKRFAVRQTTISRIVRGEQWRAA